MADGRFREQLLDYVLGAVDEAECAEIEQRLEDDPNWRAELRQIQQALEPLSELSEEVDPPSELAERTCSLVNSRAEADRICPASVGLTSALRGEYGVLSSTGQARIGEFVVTAGILLALAMLFFPAISNSRELARSTQCHNNLRRIGVAMSAYCDLTGGNYFPSVPSQGNRAFAGVYGPTLFDGGFLVDPQVLVCPSSDLAASGGTFVVPSLDQIDAAAGGDLIVMQRWAGGSFGYNLGYVQNGQLQPAQNMGRAHFAMMADAPAITLAGYERPSHGAQGINLLYEDGSVRNLVDDLASHQLDHPFRNHFGAVEPGVNEEDAVVAPSYVRPFVRSSR